MLFLFINMLPLFPTVTIKFLNFVSFKNNLPSFSVFCSKVFLLKKFFNSLEFIIKRSAPSNFFILWNDKFAALSWLVTITGFLVFIISLAISSVSKPWS